MLTGSYGLAIVVIAAVVTTITAAIVVTITVAPIGGVVTTIVCTWKRNGRAGNRKSVRTSKVGAQVADDKQEILAYC